MKTWLKGGITGIITGLILIYLQHLFSLISYPFYINFSGGDRVIVASFVLIEYMIIFFVTGIFVVYFTRNKTFKKKKSKRGKK